MSKADKSSEEPIAPEEMKDDEIPFFPLHDESDAEDDEHLVLGIPFSGQTFQQINDHIASISQRMKPYWGRRNLAEEPTDTDKQGSENTGDSMKTGGTAGSDAASFSNASTEGSAK